MLLNAVILVLREVLETALLISLLLSLSRALAIKSSWFYLAGALGLLAAIFYATQLNRFSLLFNYTGQEWLNTVMFGLSYFSLLGLLMVVSLSSPCSDKKRRIFVLLMLLPTMLAITLEGAEILIYLSGVRHSQQLLAVSMGSLMGFGIGVSVGILIYYGLQVVPNRLQRRFTLIALSLVAASNLSQSVPLLIQINFLKAYPPLWDSSGLLSEQSITGQLLYATLGYESSPAPQQVAAYVLGLLMIVIALAVIKQKTNAKILPNYTNHTK